MTPETVAVIGAGVAGLTAAYLLRRRYDVFLFEAEPRLGGHAHTHDVPGAVDSGFIVHNERTYPNLLRLFGELGVTTQDSEMSMSVRCPGCGLEYAGARGLPGLFPSAGNAVRGRYLRMLGEIPRFHRHARRLLRAGGDGVSLGEFAAGYSRYFTGSPAWRTVVGGSREYVERAAKGLTAVHVSTPVRSVLRHPGGVEVRDDAGDVHTVDGSCSPRTPTRRLPGPTPYVVTLNATDRVDQEKVLAKMSYEHPTYTAESVAAQRELPVLNTGRTAFAGACHGWGFHEDGCVSGVRAAAAFGVIW